MRSADSYNAIPQERVSTVNHEEFQELNRRIDRLLEDMARDADAYSTAKAALSYFSDRRKNALSSAISGLWSSNAELSSTAAEHKARATPFYKDALDQLYRDEVTAETICTQYHILQKRLEAARSQLAVQRELISML